MMVKKSTKSIMLILIIVGIVIVTGAAVFGFWYHNNIAVTEDYYIFPDSLVKEVGHEGFVFLKKDAETIGKKYLLNEAERCGYDFGERVFTVYFNRAHLCWVIQTELQPKDENLNVLNAYPIVRIELDGTVYIVY